jgi:hypothetical protein
MGKRKATGPGARYYLREHGQAFQAYLQSRLGGNVQVLAERLQDYLQFELKTPECCEAFWKGIKPARQGCPASEHFDDYHNILAYAFVHLLDRYLRVWEVLRLLAATLLLPMPKRLSVLDVGSGPAPALYAVTDFYRDVAAFGELNGIDRFTCVHLDLCPIELRAYPKNPAVR